LREEHGNEDMKYRRGKVSWKKTPHDAAERRKMQYGTTCLSCYKCDYTKYVLCRRVVQTAISKSHQVVSRGSLMARCGLVTNANAAAMYAFCSLIAENSDRTCPVENRHPQQACPIN
jgi:hypothetical protein